MLNLVVLATLKLMDNEGEPFKIFLFSQHIAADSQTLVRHTQRVTQRHSEFRISCFVMLSRDINPVFCKVMDILVMPDDTVYFHVLVYHTDHFYSHLFHPQFC